jgi:hypothetical protein
MEVTTTGRSAEGSDCESLDFSDPTHASSPGSGVDEIATRRKVVRRPDTDEGAVVTKSPRFWRYPDKREADSHARTRYTCRLSTRARNLISYVASGGVLCPHGMLTAHAPRLRVAQMSRRSCR